MSLATNTPTSCSSVMLPFFMVLQVYPLKSLPWSTGLYIDECVFWVSPCSRVWTRARRGSLDASSTLKDMQVSFTGVSKWPVGVNQSVNVFVYMCVIRVIDRQHAPVPAGMDCIPSGAPEEDKQFWKWMRDRTQHIKHNWYPGVLLIGLWWL